MTKPIAVVILNWNGAKLLREFLPKVISETDRSLADIIVADNGSTDESVSILENEFPEVGIIRFDKNHGFAEGYNLALKQVNHKYSILLNSDVAPAPDWLSPLYKFMEENPSTGACQPKILSYNRPDLLEYAGACGGYLDKNGYPYCRGRIFAVSELDKGQYDTVASIFWASGASLMIRTDLYRKVGGLDARFFAHMEEIDLCWRVKLAGFKIAAVPESSVFHLGGGTLPPSDPKKTYLNFRNNLLLLYKNLPDTSRRHRLLVRRLYDTLAWGMYMVRFDFKNAGSILRAHRDFRRMKSAYTAFPDVDLLPKHPNIIVQYYLLGHRIFDRISRP
ncbi:MAG: glycosyltransferase family 2 protein [Muribaculum sp.]|nr:glycosyltransferase family 2 protein [Muribaculum sp.]